MGKSKKAGGEGEKGKKYWNPKKKKKQL